MISHHHQITTIFMKMYEDVAFKLSPAKFDLSFFRSQVNMYYNTCINIYIYVYYRLLKIIIEMMAMIMVVIMVVMMIKQMVDRTIVASFFIHFVSSSYYLTCFFFSIALLSTVRTNNGFIQ